MKKLRILVIALSVSIRAADSEIEAIEEINWREAFSIEYKREAPLRFIDNHLEKIEKNKLSIFIPFVSYYYARSFNRNARKYLLPLVKLNHFSSRSDSICILFGINWRDQASQFGTLAFLAINMMSSRNRLDAYMPKDLSAFLRGSSDAIHLCRLMFGYSAISPAIRKDLVDQLRAIRAAVEKKLH